MRAINLLPPEALERAKVRRQRWLWIAGALVFVGLLAVATLWFQSRVDARKDALQAEQDEITQLQARAAGLSEFAALKGEFDTNVLILATALDRDVVWGRLLNDLGRLLPDRLWLTTFSGQVNTDPAVPTIGEVTVSGIGFEFPDVSAWLRSLDSSTFPSVDQTWVSSISAAAIEHFPIASP
jgi:type IV pilus assembly protein PilN